MKDDITPEEDFYEKHDFVKEEINEDFVIEYKSSCSECSINLEEGNSNSKPVEETASNIENKFFICLCNEIKNVIG